MDQMINISVTPLQALLAFQIWMVAFPIILIQKLNYLTNLLHEHLDKGEETPSGS